MQKIAEEAGDGECEVCGKAAPPDSKMCRECAAKKAEEEAAATGGDLGVAEEEKVSSLRVEKLASAVEEVLQNFGNMNWSGWSSKVGQALPAIPSGAHEPGDPTAVMTNETDLPPPPAPEGFGGALPQNTPPKVPKLEAPAGAESGAATAVEDNKDESMPEYPPEGVMKAGSIRELYQSVMLQKAGEDRDSTAISAEKSTMLPEEEPSTMARPSEVTHQERLIASNEAAINATKREAKEVPKKQMGEVLSEAAQSRSSDTTLDDTLGRATVDQAGAKVASAVARVLLQKIASEGCTCEKTGCQKGACDYCRIASRIGATGR
ncbi:MAG: hypothetical protein ACFFD4_39860 [Candidatus Odinarchaeota archaeon]